MVWNLGAQLVNHALSTNVYAGAAVIIEGAVGFVLYDGALGAERTPKAIGSVKTFVQNKLSKIPYVRHTDEEPSGSDLYKTLDDKKSHTYIKWIGGGSSKTFVMVAKTAKVVGQLLLHVNIALGIGYTVAAFTMNPIALTAVIGGTLIALCLPMIPQEALAWPKTRITKLLSNKVLIGVTSIPVSITAILINSIYAGMIGFTIGNWPGAVIGGGATLLMYGIPSIAKFAIEMWAGSVEAGDYKQHRDAIKKDKRIQEAEFRASINDDDMVELSTVDS